MRLFSIGWRCEKRASRDWSKQDSRSTQNIGSAEDAGTCYRAVLVVLKVQSARKHLVWAPPTMRERTAASEN
jgi:hypothetical protein